MGLPGLLKPSLAFGYLRSMANIDFLLVGVVEVGRTSELLVGLPTHSKCFLSGRSLANDDAIDQAMGTAVGVSDTWIADGDIHISAWSADVTLAGSPAGGQFVHLLLARDVDNDDLDCDGRNHRNSGQVQTGDNTPIITLSLKMITPLWKRRQTITIDHTKVTSGSHTDFPNFLQWKFS